MPFSKSSTIYPILCFLTILPTIVTSYNCNFPNVGKTSRASCKTNYDEDDSKAVSKYGICMLHLYSFSAFIQCASQPNAPKLDGPKSPIAPLDILSPVLNPQHNPDCGNCTIAALIRNTPKGKSLTKNICDQYGKNVPEDVDGDSGGICCLAKCLKGGPTEERSLMNFCDKNTGRMDLMSAPPAKCDGYTAPDPDAGWDPNIDTATNDIAKDAHTSTDKTTSTLGRSTTTSSSSLKPTSSPTSTSASTSATSAASIPTATTSSGAAERVWMTGFEVLRRIGLALLSILLIQ